jgi:hypothetical protein
VPDNTSTRTAAPRFGFDAWGFSDAGFAASARFWRRSVILNRIAPMKVIKFIAVLALCGLTQGCVGVVVGSKGTSVIRHASISETPGVSGIQAWASSYGVDYPTAWVNAHWGPPTSVKASPHGNGEIWTYKFPRQCWVGVMPMIIIPIPLMVPAGHERVVFLIHQDQVVAVTKVESRWAGVGAGLFSHEGPWTGATR